MQRLDDLGVASIWFAVLVPLRSLRRVVVGGPDVLWSQIEIFGRCEWAAGQNGAGRMLASSVLHKCRRRKNFYDPVSGVLIVV